MFGHYRNQPFTNTYLLKKPEHTIITEEQNCKGLAVIDRNELILEVNNKSYPIAMGERTPIGDYLVREKWEYPYWKKKDRIYAPSENNPIGRYLVILGTESEKIPYGIHTWPSTEGIFKQGKMSNGCIRIRKEDIEEVFTSLMLASTVKIQS